MNPQQQNNSIDQRERVRKSFDKIKVLNPTDRDRSTVWDGFHHIVKAHSYAILDRFLAEKYLEEFCKEIITQRADSAVKAENKRRVENGMAIMDKTRKTGEQYEFETPFYANWNASFPAIVRELGLYGGIEQEYGLEYVPQAPPQNTQIVGSLIDDLEKTPAPIKVAPASPGGLIDNLEGKSQFELRAIATQKGIATEKTDKKEDLIRQISQQ